MKKSCFTNMKKFFLENMTLLCATDVQDFFM